MRETGDTRQRIQDVALELFTEHGYEATSLREIAERLGVTKAALYYHFKTKEDIVASLIDDRIERLEELLEWAAQPAPQPGGRVGADPPVRRRTAREPAPQGDAFPASATRPHCATIRTASGPANGGRDGRPGQPAGRRLTARLRNAMGLFSLHADLVPGPDENITDDERHTAALKVALELLDDAPHRAAPAGAAPAAG